MKNLGKIFIVVLALFAGAYWAAANPNSAGEAKKTADSIAEGVKQKAEATKKKIFD